MPRQQPMPVWPWIGAGVTLGLGYSMIDAYLDGEMGVSPSLPLRLLEWTHTLMHHILPLLTGALLGVFVHYLQIRQQVALLERERADGLSQDLRRLERDQAVWVISASLLHDLKTPLHALGLLLDELTELPEQEAAEQRRLLTRAQQQSERLVRKLEDLRSLPASPPPLVPIVDLYDLVREIVRQSEAKLSARGIALRVDGKRCRSRVHPAYLKIVLDNLIQNAANAMAGGRGGQILVEVQCGEDGTRLVVEDDGPGIAVEAEENLFSPLKTTKSHGLGLGLSIARSLLRAMGGEITHEPNALGARFIIRLGSQELATT